MPLLSLFRFLRCARDFHSRSSIPILLSQAAPSLQSRHSRPRSPYVLMPWRLPPEGTQSLIREDSTVVELVLHLFFCGSFPPILRPPFLALCMQMGHPSLVVLTPPPPHFSVM